MARRYYHKTRSYAWLWWLLLTALLVYGGWRLYNRWFVFNPQAILEDAILKEKNFDTEVKEITSPKAKIKAYLFQDKTNPIISINFLFKNAGLSTDETQQSGISTMAAALLTEGAGNLDSQQFKEILEQKAVGMGFSADMDDFSGHLLTTRENMNTAFKMLNMAMTQPRFDEEDIDGQKRRCWRLSSGRPNTRPGFWPWRRQRKYSASTLMRAILSATPRQLRKSTGRSCWNSLEII